MSLAGHLTRARGARRDPRAMAAGCAAVVASILAVGQLLLAQWVGVLTWRDGAANSGGAGVDEPTLVIWLTAVSVGIGAAGSRQMLDAAPGRQMSLALTGMAVVGALLAAPVATAIAVWSHMYGGDLSQLRVLRLVLCGVTLGGVAALAALKSRVAAWSLGIWMVAIWVFLLIAHMVRQSGVAFASLEPGGHDIQGDIANPGTLLLLGLGVIGGVGMALAFKRRRRGHRTPLPHFRHTLAAAGGPGVAFSAYGLAAATVGWWNPWHAVGLATTALIAAISFAVTMRLTRSRARPTSSERLVPPGSDHGHNRTVIRMWHKVTVAWSMARPRITWS